MCIGYDCHFVYSLSFWSHVSTNMFWKYFAMKIKSEKGNFHHKKMVKITTNGRDDLVSLLPMVLYTKRWLLLLHHNSSRQKLSSGRQGMTSLSGLSSTYRDSFLKLASLNIEILFALFFLGRSSIPFSLVPTFLNFGIDYSIESTNPNLEFR